MRRRGFDFWLGFWALIFMASSVVLAYFDASGMHADQQKSFALRAVDQQGRLRIDWDPQDDLIRKAQGATLEVDDGGVVNRYPVEPTTLRAGGFDYLRKSSDVLLTLTLFHNGKPDALATVRSVGSVQAAAVPESATEPEGRSSQRRKSSQVRTRRR